MRVQICIKEIAEQQGVNVKELVKRTGVSRATIERLWDGGSADNIRIGILARIGEALGVPTCDLIVDIRDE